MYIYIIYIYIYIFIYIYTIIDLKLPLPVNNAIYTYITYIHLPVLHCGFTNDILN